jgi:hypothetical protein
MCGIQLKKKELKVANTEHLKNATATAITAITAITTTTATAITTITTITIIITTINISTTTSIIL